MRFRFFYLITVALLYVSSSGATMDPWYSVRNIDKLEINIYFEESSLEIKPYYKFHLGLFGEILKANPELSLVITHGGSTSFSQVRSRHLYSYFSQQEQMPIERVFIHEGLSSRYLVEKGERILIFLKRLSKNIEPVEEEIVIENEPPVTIESEIFIVEPEGVKDRPPERVEGAVKLVSPERRPNIWQLELGLGHRAYSFTGRSRFSAYVLDFGVAYQFTDRMKFKLDAQGAMPEVSGDADVEYDLRLGFDTAFEMVELQSRMYHKSNFIWVGDLDRFDTVLDYGLSQKIEIKLFKFTQTLLKIGFTAEISFSNNFSAIDSANVYGSTTDIQIVFRNLNLKTLVYFTQREYKTTGGLFDVNIFGVSLKYEF